MATSRTSSRLLGPSTVAGDLTVTGDLSIANDELLEFGTTVAAATASIFSYNTTQTVDSLMLGLDETSRSFHICDFGDIAFNFATSAQSHPTLFLHSSAQSTTQFATISQTGTNLEIKNTGAAGSTTVFTGGATGIALQSVADQAILVGGGGFLALRSTSTSFRENNGIETFGGTSKGFYVNGSRLQGTQGSDVASATAITLGAGTSFEITGTTTIDQIVNTNWQEGAEVTLIFNASLTVRHGIATSGSSVTILLAGAANFSATANDTLTLIYSSTTAGGIAWREKCRTVI